MHSLFQTAACGGKKSGEIQAVFADHRSQLRDLGESCQSLKGSLERVENGLQQQITQLIGELASLREDHEALRDCLSVRSMVHSCDIHHRLSIRRAATVFKNILAMPELALHLGECAGVMATRRLRELSRSPHSYGLVSALSVLARSHPPDVIVCGGKNDSSIALATVEGFSPRTGEWHPLPPMRVARYGCAAAALNGCLYVVGGHDGRNVLPTAERFHPSSGTWELLPPMLTARSRCAAVALRGWLYVIGGRDSKQRVTAAERLEPASRRWEHLPPMPMAPMGCAATMIGGILYVVGVSGDREMAAQRFDPSKFAWESLPAVPRQRFGCAAASSQGTFYIVGGHNGQQAVSVCEQLVVLKEGAVGAKTHVRTRSATDLDLSSGGSCWQTLAPLPTARHGCAAAFAGAHLYVVGGDDGRGHQSLKAMECFDPRTGLWTPMQPVPTGRFGCAAAALWQ